MSLDTRRPIDLYAILAFLPLAFLAAWSDGWVWVRAPIGLAFLLFVPGYALVAMLYPEGLSQAKLVSRQAGPDRGEAMENLAPERSLFAAERVAFSVAASIAVTSAVGLVLNFLDAGITPASLAVGLVGTTLGLSLIALAVRRLDVPLERRPRFVWTGTRIPPLTTGREKAMAVVLVLSLLLLGGAAAYTLPLLRGSTGYTAFHTVQNEAPQCYPIVHLEDNLFAYQNATGCPSEPFTSLAVAVDNHEGREVLYRVVVHWETQGDLDGGGMGHEIDRYDVRLPDSGQIDTPQVTRAVPLGLPPYAGLQFLVIDLYIADRNDQFAAQPDQSLQLRVAA